MLCETAEENESKDACFGEVDCFAATSLEEQSAAVWLRQWLRGGEESKPSSVGRA